MFKKWLNGFKFKFAAKNSPRKKPIRRSRPLLGRILEELEDRTVPSTSILNNSGNGFTGIGFEPGTLTQIPLSAVGAAGPSVYVEAVNQMVAIYPKDYPTSTTPYQSTSLFNFFRKEGQLPPLDSLVSSTQLGGDETVTFDELLDQSSGDSGGGGRFIVTDDEYDKSSYKSCIDLAVSKTNNPQSLTTADWNFYQIITTENKAIGYSQNFQADMPANLGYNNDGIFLTLDMFHTNQGVPPDHSQIVAIKAADLISGNNSVQIPIAKNDFWDQWPYNQAPTDSSWTQHAVRATTMHDSTPSGTMWLVTEHVTNPDTTNPIDGQHIDVINMTNYFATNGARYNVTSLLLPSQYYYSEPNPLQNPTTIAATIANNPTGSVPASGSAQYSQSNGKLTVQVHGAEPNANLGVGVSTNNQNTLLTSGTVYLQTDALGNGSVTINSVSSSTIKIGSNILVGLSDGEHDLFAEDSTGSNLVGTFEAINVFGPFDSRIIKVAEDNGTLVAAQSAAPVGSTTQDVAQWYAIDVTSGTPQPFSNQGGDSQVGRISAGNNTYIAYPAIDINSAGQIGMSYLQAGNDTVSDYMSMWVTGRATTDPVGTMQTPVQVPNGTGVANYVSLSADGAGDYSGINIDPSGTNAGSFWATNEFATGQGTVDTITRASNGTITLAYNGSNGSSLTLNASTTAAWLQANLSAISGAGLNTDVVSFASAGLTSFAYNGSYASGSNRYLSYSPFTTATTNITTASDFQSYLSQIPGLTASGAVSVIGPDGGPFTVSFASTIVGSNLLTKSDVSTGDAIANASIVTGPNGGPFQVTFGTGLTAGSLFTFSSGVTTDSSTLDTIVYSTQNTGLNNEGSAVAQFNISTVSTSTTINASVSGSSVSSVSYGTPVTLIATVSATSGSNAPVAGSVDFQDGSFDLGVVSSETVSGTNAVFTLITTANQLQVILANSGNHTITAAYSGSGFGSSSATLGSGLTVTPASLTITATSNTKTYDATANAAAAPTVSGLKGADTVTSLAAYNNANAGSSKTISISSYTINDSNGGQDYTVTTMNNTAGVINKAPLTITALTNTKTQDGQITAAAIPTVSGLQRTDTVTGLTEQYSDSNNGTGKTLSISAYTVNDGNSGNNYSVTTVTNTTGTIKAPGTLTATTVSAAAGGTTVSTVTYGTLVTLTATIIPNNGTTAPTAGNVDFQDGSLDLGVISSETVSGSNAIFALITTANQLQVIQANGGIHTITTTYHSGSGFNDSAGTLSGGLGVTAKSLTINAVTNTKAYDSTSTAGATPTVSGLVGSDTVTGMTEKYSGANAGSSKTLSVSAYTVNDSNGGADYTVSTVNNTAGVITKAALTITSSADTKTYDSTTTASAIPTYSGIKGADTVSGLIEAYASTNAGSETLSVSAYTVNDGNSGNNYTVTTVTNTMGLIYRASLTITAVTNTKTYDATLAAAVTPTVAGLIGSDTVTGLSEAFNNANVGTGKTLSVYTGNPAVATLTGLNNPQALAIDGSGNLYVANYGNNTVSKFASNGTLSATLTGLSNPAALAFDGSGNLYVANSGDDTVSKFLPGHTTASTTLTGLNNPQALAIDGSGNLYVANYGNNTVSKFASNGTLSTLIGFNGAITLVLDSSGNLYVANLGNGTVSKFAPGATTPSATLTLPSGSTPISLAVDASGNIYVGDSNYGTVCEFAPGATAPNTPLTLPSGGNPMALAFDSSGNLYVGIVIDGTTDMVSMFAPGATTPSATVNGLSNPVALAFDGSGNLYVANYNANTVSKFSPIYTINDGNDGNNYSVTLVNNTTGVINTAALTITAVTNTKTYDATLAAAATPAVSGLQGNDTVPNLSEIYDNANAGTGKTLSVYTGNPTVATFTGLTAPDALAIDSSGNLYVANLIYGTGGLDTVSKFAPGATTPSATLTGLSFPSAMAFDGSGNLYVANAAADTVSKFAPGATTPSATLTGLSAPEALAFDGSGNLYVANSTAGTVSKFLPGHTTPSATLTGLSAPEALAFDGSGNLYVANIIYGTGSLDTVCVFAPGATTPSATLTGLSTPVAMAFDGSGNLYVANAAADTVSKFAPGATTPSATLTGLSTPVAMAVDGSGNLYVTNEGNNTVSRFSPGAPTASVTLTGLNNPTAMAFDGSSNLYVANYNANTVSKFSPIYTINDGNDGNNYSVTLVNNTTGVINKAALTITAVTKTKTYDETLTAAATPTVAGLKGGDTVSGLSEAFNNANAGTGKTLSIYAGNPAVATLTGLNNPQALAFDGSGNLYVANSGNDTVSKLTPDGTLSATLTGLSNPAALAFDGSGNLYVANFGNDTVSKFLPGHTTASATLTGLSSPNALAFDGSGNLYVANYGSTTVSKFASNGTLTTLTGLNMPVTLVFDGSGNLYVANQGSGTVSKFAPGATTPSATLTLPSGSTPNTLAVDASGNVYVGESTNDTVCEFAAGTTTLNPILDLSSSGTPESLAIDSSGNLYVGIVIDGTNDIVSMFAPGATTPRATLTGLSAPAALAFDGSGNLYVANTNASTVSKFNPIYTVDDGNGGNNYTVTLVNNTTGVINKATLTITAVTNTKTYDATTAAAATPTVAGLKGGDTVSGLSEAFNNANAGTGKTLSISAYTINDGNGGGNYTVTTVNNSTGVINKASLTITAVTNTKTYDATTAAAATPTVAGLKGGDTVSGLSEAFNNANAGTGKTLSISAYTINDGNGGGNYTVTTVNNSTGVINKASLTITAVTNTKTYDGTVIAAAAPTISGLVGGDTVTGLSEFYNNANTGTGKTLSVSAYTINDGNSGSNYTVTTVNNTTGVIN